MANQPVPPDTDYRHAYMAAIIAITVIAVLTAWLRVYTRIYISHNAWWDDWVMFAATLLTISTNGILVEAYRLGIGRHIAYIPPAQIPECFKWLWVAEPTNLFALYAVRLSITLFFLRLIPASKKLYRRIVWGSIVALTVSDVYVSINYFIQCRPIQKVWRPELPGACLGDKAYAIAPWVYQGVSIVVDLALISIPCLMLHSIKLPRKTKFGVIFLCSLGVFTCICAVVKTALLPALFNKSDLDKTWSLAQLCLWAPMEICVGMICGSLACLKPFYQSLRGHYPAPPSLFPGTSLKDSQDKSPGIYRTYDIECRSSPVDLDVELDVRTRSEDLILPNYQGCGSVKTVVNGARVDRPVYLMSI